ncbi:MULTISPECIES: L-threonylcarbamoyladenylate synthase [Staphylococcus]|uniref:L-threonylcarbamoyladenylate synthase n=1 Tax=Staphylococcus TaxID=1279 RepID=UPI0002464074|nr:MULTISPECIES: L-threonylcarbamoyladenylate synthase [Staphylococcus]QAV30093.1 threonylcarbamoyl-AMP synthase [Sulfitobacter donghicola]AGZ24861.1 Sua5/YciO/YrdC/YwlC family protein [Staphylococcus pasteuri SP1]MBN6853918.1 threonylcarbamoyl-AMP synthase [Staphylococcus warneri]MBT2770428.1 threonylcarbamoyl-AMP synthase [Staphylococcus warneri]MBX7841425.1 threonylcarbamoyl-AMP synthase [Staphylococcus warneri]
METKIWDLRKYSNDIHQSPDVQEIKDTVLNGGLVALPTETVYGLGADATNQEAVSHIYEAKGRPSDNPLIVHIHDMSQMNDFIDEVEPKVQRLMEAFWPGPISFILPLKSGYLCQKVTGGLNSIAVRMPSHSIGRHVLQQIDKPIAAPSANISGRPSPTTFEHVYQDMNGRIDGIINGDQSEEGLESTVLDCTQYPFRIARPGSITKMMLENVIPDCIESSNYNEASQPIAPGMKYKHYSPDTPVTILEELNEKILDNIKWEQVAFIVPESLSHFLPKEATYIKLCDDEADIKQANHLLYSILHEIDQRVDITQAYIYGFDESDQSEAIMNRMLKAAGNKIVKEASL